MTAPFEDQLALVKELQQIDLGLHRIESDLRRLPERFAEQRAAYEEVGGRLNSLKSELAETEHQKRTDEQELAASVEHLREREARLYAIKTNKEYQAAIKEISEGKKRNREREDRILQAMERAESLGKEIAQLQTEFAEKESALNEAAAAVAVEERELRQSHEEQTARKPQVIERLEKEILRKYEFIRRRYTDALVPVTSGVCSGCSRRIPPQLYNEMLRREALRACPNCQRLIYVEAEKQGDDAAEGAL